MNIMKVKKLLCYFLVLSMITGLCPATAMATTSEETTEQKIIYSDDETVQFEGKEPVYAEAEKPDTPGTPDEPENPDTPDDPEEDEKPENPFAGFVNVIKKVTERISQFVKGFVKIVKDIFGFWGKCK